MALLMCIVPLQHHKIIKSLAAHNHLGLGRMTPNPRAKCVTSWLLEPQDLSLCTCSQELGILSKDGSSSKVDPYVLTISLALHCWHHAVSRDLKQNCSFWQSLSVTHSCGEGHIMKGNKLIVPLAGWLSCCWEMANVQLDSLKHLFSTT